MKNWIFPLGIVLFVLLWTVLCPLKQCVTDGKYNFIDLNYAKKDSSFVLPKGYSLLYNPYTNEYIVHIRDKEWAELELVLSVSYISPGLNYGLASAVPNSVDITRFKDSSVAKYYAHLWYNNQVKNTGFKPISDADVHTLDTLDSGDIERSRGK